MIVKHMKSGNDYVVLGRATDATNYRADQSVVLYTRKNLMSKFLCRIMDWFNLELYVRDIYEFEEKFKRH